MILNLGPLDWESSTLKTMPLAHRDNAKIAPNKNILEKYQNWTKLKHSLLPSLPSSNKTFAIAVKKYAKADISFLVLPNFA